MCIIVVWRWKWHIIYEFRKAEAVIVATEEFALEWASKCYCFFFLASGQLWPTSDIWAMGQSLYFICSLSPASKNNPRRQTRLTKKDCKIMKWIVSKNCRTTTTRVTAELKPHLTNHVSLSTKVVCGKLHKIGYQDRDTIAKFFLSSISTW